MSRILYIQYTNPGGYPPLQHSSNILAEAGWKVLFLGTGALGANSLDLPPNPRIKLWRMTFSAAGWRQKVHYLAFCLWVLLTALLSRPECVYASDPLSCPVALILTWMPGLCVIYHEHDAPASNTRDQKFFTQVLRSRRSLARRADMCILPNAKRLKDFEIEAGPLRRSACVWNCPGLYETTTTPRGPAQPLFSVLYQGSIVPERLPLTVIDAVALLPESVRLRVIGYETIGSPGYIGDLERYARALGLANRIEFLPAMSRAELMKATLNSDIGLALFPLTSLDQNILAMSGASNKAFDYLACGLPVITSDLCDWRKMFVEPGYGLACDPGDPRSIASAIGWLIGHPEQMREMGESGRQRVLSEWNYETEFRPVFDYLSSAGRNDSAVREVKQSR